MLEFILKDDYTWDDENYDYLVRIYDVVDKDAVMKVIRDYINFIKDNKEHFDDCIINYLTTFLKENFVKHDIFLLKDMEIIYY